MNAWHMTRWSRATFRLAIVAPDDNAEVDGIVMEDVGLGLHLAHFHSIDVTHLASGKRIAGFPTLGAAMEFAGRIGHLIDWRCEEVILSEVLAKTIEDLRRVLEASAFSPRVAR